MTLLRIITSLAACAALSLPAAASAQTLPPLDITKLDYSPIGHFKPGEEMPASYGKACDADMRPLLNQNGVFNPSGKYNSFDTNVFENICLPFRNQDDTSANDVWGNGDPNEDRYGYCAGASMTAEPTSEEAAGTCPNHQLEFIEYFQKTMAEVLKDFGVTFQVYEFEHPEGVGRNPAAIVAGADHSDEHIIIGSHYDQTTTGPASAWDSQEGHAEMIRVAKIMADYWKATGTRPSATIKFAPIDGEEDGLHGSQDYVNNTIVPGEENKVRSYWNADPCAGGYPAYHYGNRSHRIDMGIQIGDSDEERVNAFNETVQPFVEQILNHIDDTMDTYPDRPQLFVGPEDGPVSDLGTDIFIGKDQPVLFSSDWANFIAAGIPFFNPGPEVTGPNVPGEGEPPGPNNIGTPEALYQLHTPLDNLQTMMRYTGPDPAGMSWSEGWMKGMEFCSNMLAWGMLQPNAGGAQTVNTDVVAYYEALPNEATRGSLVRFDAGGSYQYADTAGRTYVDEAQLQFKWDFGDGTATAYGKEVRHSYKRTGTFASKLTVTNRKTGQAKTMSVPITVEEGGTANEEDPPGQNVDKLPPQDAIVACQSTDGFSKVTVRPSGAGLRFDLARSGNSPIKIDVYRAATGRSASKPRRVRSFNVTESFTWNGKPAKGKLSRGTYHVIVSTVQPNGRPDRRGFAFTRTSKFKARKAFQLKDSCELISSFRLGSPAFGPKRALEVGFSTTQAGKATITLYRGSSRKAARKVSRTVKAANRFQRVSIPARKLRKGEYRVVLKVTAGGTSKSATLYARKL